MVRDRRRKGAEKQTERLEVRLGVTQRDQFLAACKRAGDTPSDVLRAAMSSYIAKVQSAERKTLRQELTMKLIHNPLKAAGMALTSLAAFAMIAAPSSADERLFSSYDKDKNGQITEAEIDAEAIAALDTDQSGSITLQEFTPISHRETITDKVSLTDTGSEKREIGVLVRVIDLSQPGEADFTDWGISAPIPIDMTESETEDFAKGLLRMMKAHSTGVPHSQLIVPFHPSEKTP